VTSEQLYLFDLQGFLVVKGALSSEVVTTLLSDWDSRAKSRPLFDITFSWNQAWASLTDLDNVLPIVDSLTGGSSRIDHAFAIDENFYSTKDRLHHCSAGFRRGIYYVVQKGQIHSSLITVSFALTESRIGDASFCCIPGSHKSEFDTPAQFFEIANNPLAIQVIQQAGDAIIFTEALTHGTFPIRSGASRRSVLIRYCPGFVQFRKAFRSSPISRLPLTPKYVDPSADHINPELLTPRQRHLLMEPPYAVDEHLRDRRDRIETLDTKS